MNPAATHAINAIRNPHLIDLDTLLNLARRLVDLYETAENDLRTTSEERNRLVIERDALAAKLAATPTKDAVSSNANAPAFPFQVRIPGGSYNPYRDRHVPLDENDTEVFLVLPSLAYFAAHAPAEPQSWFEPIIPPPPVNRFAHQDSPQGPFFELACEAAKHYECISEYLSNFAYDDTQAWKKDAEKQRYLQWPIAWANAILNQFSAK